MDTKEFPDGHIRMMVVVLRENLPDIASNLIHTNDRYGDEKLWFKTSILIDEYFVLCFIYIWHPDTDEKNKFYEALRNQFYNQAILLMYDQTLINNYCNMLEEQKDRIK